VAKILPNFRAHFKFGKKCEIKSLSLKLFWLQSITKMNFLKKLIVVVGVISGCFFGLIAQTKSVADEIKAFLSTEEGQKLVFEAVTTYARREQQRVQERAQKEMAERREEQFKNPVNVPIGDSPIIGNPKAKITIVEFSDFECPFCARSQATLRQILDRYGDEVRIVFKHRPLEFHKNARKAHRAAIAAHSQGKFKEAKEFLFSNNNRLGDDRLYEEMVSKLGLKKEKFFSDMNSEDAERILKADEELADSLKVGGTPTFFINGVMLEGAYPFEEFETIINRWRSKA
jgi:protein-disulfide isomerase